MRAGETRVHPIFRITDHKKPFTRDFKKVVTQKLPCNMENVTSKKECYKEKNIIDIRI